MRSKILGYRRKFSTIFRHANWITPSQAGTPPSDAAQGAAGADVSIEQLPSFNGVLRGDDIGGNA
jgi:hypothetical protein